MDFSAFSDTKLNGKDVIFIRKKLGLSQNRLSRYLGVSPVTIYLWEKFKQEISPQNQKKLAEIIEAMNNHEKKEKNKLN